MSAATSPHSGESGPICGHPNHGAADHNCAPFLPCSDPACPCGPKAASDPQISDAAFWREKETGNCKSDRGGYYADGWRDGYAKAAEHGSEGWASYAAEQERHAETVARAERAEAAVLAGLALAGRADARADADRRLVTTAALRAALPASGHVPEPCIAPPGYLCTETGCWDADRCVVFLPEVSPMDDRADEQEATPNADAVARVEAFLRGWDAYRGGVGLASRSGNHLLLKDVRTIVAALRDGPYPCGHFDVLRGCGGCDLTATEGGEQR